MDATRLRAAATSGPAVAAQEAEVAAPVEVTGKIAFGPKHSTPEELAAFLKVQMETWRRTAESVGIKPE